MKINPVRAMMTGSLAVSVAIAAGAPARWWIVIVLSGLGACGIVMFLALDGWHREWLRNRTGRPAGIGPFISHIFPSACMVAAGTWAAFLTLIHVRLAPAGVAATLMWVGWSMSGLAIVAAMTATAFHRDSELTQLSERLGRRPLGQLFKKSVDFETTTLRRLLFPLILVSFASAFYLSVALAVAGGIGAGGWVLHKPGSPNPLAWSTIPILFKISFGIALAAIWVFGAGWLLAFFDMVDDLREVGYFRRRPVARYLDHAIGTIGVFPTITAGAAWTCLLGIFIFAGYLVYTLLIGQHIAPPLAICGGIVAGGVGFWLLAILPVLWVFPIQINHDCGWVNAIEASTRLLALERGRAIAVAAMATVLASTVVGIPAAMAVILGALDGLAPLLKVLLRERPLREVLAEVTAVDEQTSLPRAVVEAFQALDEGRFLDAVNGFQIFLRANPAQPDATRGEAIAMLFLGNTVLARDRLERWMRIDPDNPDAKRYYEELELGLWSEGGSRYQEMQIKNKQKIGKGLTVRETLAEMREGS